MREWMPIETAPKDGTPLLVYSPDSVEPNIFTAIWVDWADQRGFVVDGEFIDLSTEMALDCTLTHWMPLPEPPHA